MHDAETGHVISQTIEVQTRPITKEEYSGAYTQLGSEGDTHETRPRNGDGAKARGDSPQGTETVIISSTTVRRADEPESAADDAAHEPTIVTRVVSDNTLPPTATVELQPEHEVVLQKIRTPTGVFVLNKRLSSDLDAASEDDPDDLVGRLSRATSREDVLDRVLPLPTTGASNGSPAARDGNAGTTTATSPTTKPPLPTTTTTTTTTTSKTAATPAADSALSGRGRRYSWSNRMDKLKAKAGGLAPITPTITLAPPPPLVDLRTPAAPQQPLPSTASNASMDSLLGELGALSEMSSVSTGDSQAHTPVGGVVHLRDGLETPPLGEVRALRATWDVCPIRA